MSQSGVAVNLLYLLAVSAGVVIGIKIAFFFSQRIVHIKLEPSQKSSRQSKQTTERRRTCLTNFVAKKASP